jgi:hypothetical protein
MAARVELDPSVGAEVGSDSSSVGGVAGVGSDGVAGASVGLGVTGAEVGNMDGLSELKVGTSVGTKVSFTPVGVMDTDGPGDGPRVGGSVGGSVGFPVGNSVGTAVVSLEFPS